MRALDDLVVLDLSRYLTGPYPAYLLGQMGAYVIKVEKPYVGEEFRLFPPFYNGESLVFPGCNINKRSLCLNLRNNKAIEVLMRLLPHVDVLIQNYRAGTIEKMGLDWDTIHRQNPRLIMANFSGFGQDGPYSRRVAFDSIILSESGLIYSIMWENGGIPCYPGGDCGGNIAALTFLCAIMAALNVRDCTGEGQYLEVDMMSAVSSLFSPEISLYQASGTMLHTSDMSPCGFYRTKDGFFVQISCRAQLWEALKEVTALKGMDHPDYSTLENRIHHKETLDKLLEGWTSTQNSADICAQLEAKGIGAAVVRNYKDILANEHAKAAHCFKQVNVPNVGIVPYPDVPFQLSDSLSNFGEVPKIGQHNYEVLHSFLKMTDQEVKELLEEGVLYQADHACWK